MKERTIYVLLIHIPRNKMSLECDAVFEGGGVKGIGLVGAIKAVEERGYKFKNLAGTSAGAIVASLLAVGYTGDELEYELNLLEYKNFKDKDLSDRFGIIGKSMDIFFEYGIYEGDYFTQWIERLFQAKDKKTTFGDIKIPEEENEKYKYKLNVIASDLTDKKMLILPQDLKDFNKNPDDFKLSEAIRMSMSIPIFFEPYKLKDKNGKTHYIVDGGILSNYPIWLLDDNTNNPERPTFGFKFSEDIVGVQKKDRENPISSVFDYTKALVGTMLDAHDKQYISTTRGDIDRTIIIPVVVNIDGVEKKISTIDFDITKDESDALYRNGYNAACKFLDTWDFKEWKRKFRMN